MGAMASQITSLTIVYSAVYSDADRRKHQRSASLAFVRGIHRAPVNSPQKWPVTRKMFPLDDVIMPWDLIVVIFFLPVLGRHCLRCSSISGDYSCLRADQAAKPCLPGEDYCIVYVGEYRNGNTVQCRYSTANILHNTLKSSPVECNMGSILCECWPILYRRHRIIVYKSYI